MGREDAWRRLLAGVGMLAAASASAPGRSSARPTAGWSATVGFFQFERDMEPVDRRRARDGLDLRPLECTGRGLPSKPAGGARLGRSASLAPTPIPAIIDLGECAVDEACRAAWLRAAGRCDLSRRRRSPSSGGRAGADYQPPPPPPPPPPPDDPPPPEPLLDPGAVEAELIVLASDEPTLSTKPPGCSTGCCCPNTRRSPAGPALRPPRARRRSGRPSGSRPRARSHRADTSRTAPACPRAASCGRAARAR